MSEYVKMPKDDYVAAADAIRTKTGKTDLIKSGQLATEIFGITGGGSADVRYVTFMSHDGLIEYGKKAVAVGDDCADPIVRGVFDTPTKESDVQYNYTFYGWANEANGAADSNWNKSITEDKTVYANFSASVRYYTITYYDSDGTTVLKTESKAYGSSLNYTPEKDGYSFAGWQPELATVTGAASYTAIWEEVVTFAGGSWADIIEIAESGQARNYFKVGDKKTIPWSTYNIELTVVGFEHDNLQNGTKAAMSIMCLTPTNDTTAYMYNYSSTVKAYYGNNYCKVPSYLRDYIKPKLPSDLQAGMKIVVKPYDASCDSGDTTTANDVRSIWIPSLHELGYAANSTYPACGEKYEYFDDVAIGGKLPIAVLGSDGTTKVEYWTRNQRHVGVNSPVTVQTTGSTGTEQGAEMATDKHYLVFGFCI